jgi:hypothetical protein
MGLPRVNIDFINGALGSVVPNADGVCGLLTTATAVSGDDKLKLNKAYVIRKLSDLVLLGVTDSADDANKLLYRHVAEFYSEAGDGAELWLMGFASTSTPVAMLNREASNGVSSLIQTSGRRIRTLGVLYGGSNGEAASGMGAYFASAITKAQELAEWSTEALYAPLVVLLEANGFTGPATAVPDLSEMGYNRTGVLVGDTDPASTGSAIGVLMGRVARIAVQRHVGRVADGALKPISFYIKNQAAETYDVETLFAKGYITVRTFTGKAGYFFSDDSLATAPEDDYRSLARRRVIDKAYRIAYVTLLQFVNDEIPVTDEGKIPASTCKSWQNEVERAIETQMTAEGNLGADPSNANDTGVQCWIDADQNVVATGIVEVNLRVKPYGYAKYINVKLGFSTVNG